MIELQKIKSIFSWTVKRKEPIFYVLQKLQVNKPHLKMLYFGTNMWNKTSVIQ